MSMRSLNSRDLEVSLFHFHYDISSYKVWRNILKSMDAICKLRPESIKEYNGLKKLTKIRGSPKSIGLTFKAPWMSVQHFTAIYPMVIAIFPSGPLWWVDWQQTDFAISEARCQNKWYHLVDKNTKFPLITVSNTVDLLIWFLQNLIHWCISSLNCGIFNNALISEMGDLSICVLW